MIHTPSLEQLSISALTEQAQRDIQLYLCHRPTANRAAFEIFRRACALHDELAWSAIYQLYSNLVSSWVLHIVTEDRITSDEVASFVNATFAKFAKSITPEKFVSFTSAEPLLAYCKLCTRSVVLDEMRSKLARQSHEQPIEGMEDEPLIDDPADALIGQLEASEVWHLICCEITRVDERLILQYSCVQGWPPRELQRQYPRVFASVNDVYRVKRNVIDRIRRNEHLLARLQRGARS